MKKQIVQQEIKIPIGELEIDGILNIPPDSIGIVLFAHGSGSSRFSPRNQYVAKVLQDENVATLLMDLFTSKEELEDLSNRELRFNIPFLAERLLRTTEWIESYEETHSLSCGYFGASTGAAAALMAAAEYGEKIKAVVSRGGRPDLAGPALPRVLSPTLLIVGGADHGVIELNEQAYAMLSCKKKMEVIPNATHLFEEQGALEDVARLAKIWFTSHFTE